MLAGMTYMHHRGFANRDIKLENMLIGEDFSIKIADFGFAKPMQGRGDGKTESFLGTPGYMAPEIIEDQAYSGQAVDVYALGIVLFAMVTGAQPFEACGNLGRGQTMVASDKQYLIFNTDKDKFWRRYN